MRKLKGNFDAQEAVQEVPTASKVKVRPEFSESKTDTFKISVKDNDGKVKYSNDEESYTYPVVDSLANALRYHGMDMSDDQITFLNEALSGEKSGAAVREVIDIVNDALRTKAKNSAYQRVFNTHKPLDAESKDTAAAAMVRNFMRLNNVSDETAIDTLKQFGGVPSDYTVAQFRDR